jgi:hypothetical protein
VEEGLPGAHCALQPLFSSESSGSISFLISGPVVFAARLTRTDYGEIGYTPLFSTMNPSHPPHRCADLESAREVDDEEEAWEHGLSIAILILGHSFRCRRVL